MASDAVCSKCGPGSFTNRPGESSSMTEHMQRGEYDDGDRFPIVNAGAFECLLCPPGSFFGLSGLFSICSNLILYCGVSACYDFIDLSLTRYIRA
jgi:hypothetical protein